MPRFGLSLWDANGYIVEYNLTNAAEIRVEEELNGVQRLSFSYPIGDDVWDNITFRKIVRLEDRYKDTPSDNISAVSASARTVTVADGGRFAVGNFVIVFEDSPPTESFIAKITAIATNVLTLSRMDSTISPAASGGPEIRVVNFDTFRINRVKQINNERGHFVQAECGHISYDLTDTLFLKDGRGDISWGIRGGGAVQAEHIDPDDLLDEIVSPHIDGESLPINVSKFFKGTLTGIYTGADVNAGTVSVTNDSVTVTGSGTSFTGAENAVIYFDDDPNRYYVTSVASATSLKIDRGVKRATASGLLFLITQDNREISFSGDTLRSALIGLCDNYTDHQQSMWFTIREDKSIDLTAERLLDTDHDDSNDPSSDLEVVYERKLGMNARAIEREYDPKDFGNVIMPRGASGNWINAETGVSATVNALGTQTTIPLAAADMQKFRWGDAIQVYQSPSSFTVASSTQTSVTATAPGWTHNQFAGGLIYVKSGSGQGQVRRILQNDTTTITISRRWDIPPTGATCIAARTIGQTQVRGFGVQRHKVSRSRVRLGSGSDYIQVDDNSPTYAEGEYMGGLLAVTNSTGSGQVHTILYNDNGDHDGDGDDTDVRFYVDGTLSAVANTASFEVVGLSQSSFDLPADFLQSKVSSTIFTIKTATVAQTQWIDGIWSNGSTGKVMFTHGTGAGTTEYSITASAWDGSNWRITISGTLPASLDSTTEGVIWRVNDSLDMSIEKIGFAPDSSTSDEIVLLIHETGGALQVGKHTTSRSTVEYATSTILAVRSGEGVRFKAGQTIFVGAKTITSAVLFGIRRGDQTTGKTYEIDSISTDELTIRGKMDPVPLDGDHVEVVSLSDPASITAYGRREKAFDGDTADPVELRRKAEIYLEMISTPRPRYRINFAYLYEYDATKYANATYSLGDTIRLVDSELGIDTDTLRIVKHSWNALHPADRTVDVASTGLKRISDITERIIAPPPALSSPYTTLGAIKSAGRMEHATLGALKAGATAAPQMHAPPCAYWDDDGRYCRRDQCYNTFCNSEESNRDGRLTASLRRIRLSDCQSFRRIRLNQFGDSTVGYTSDAMCMCVASGVESLTNVTNTKQHLYVGSAKGVDFMVSHVLMLLLEAEDTLATYTYESDYGNTTITVKETGSGDIQADTEILNPHGYVMSAAAADQSNGNGFAYTAQAPAGKTYDAFVLWWAWGYPQ